MTEVSTNLQNIFFHKIPPILKVEVGIFSDKKSSSQNDFLANFIISELNVREVSKDLQNNFTPILQVEVGVFSDKKVCRKTPKIRSFFLTLIMSKV